jgi:hypothetical protein
MGRLDFIVSNDVFSQLAHDPQSQYSYHVTLTLQLYHFTEKRHFAIFKKKLDRMKCPFEGLIQTYGQEINFYSCLNIQIILMYNSWTE